MKNCVTSRIKIIAPICKRPWATSLTSGSVTFRKQAWEKVSPLWLLSLVWTSLNPIYQKISKITSSFVKICTGWIWRRLSIYFYYFAVISPWKRTYQTWYLWTLRCFVQRTNSAQVSFKVVWRESAFCTWRIHSLNFLDGSWGIGCPWPVLGHQCLALTYDLKHEEHVFD